MFVPHLATGDTAALWAAVGLVGRQVWNGMVHDGSASNLRRAQFLGLGGLLMRFRGRRFGGLSRFVA